MNASRPSLPVRYRFVVTAFAVCIGVHGETPSVAQELDVPAQQTPNDLEAGGQVAKEEAPNEQSAEAFAVLSEVQTVVQTAATTIETDPSAASSVLTPNTVSFTFDGVPWRDVIDWIAEEAGFALHVDSVPAGSFTYKDPATFTHQDAIDRINLFLLPQGYSLVRSGNLLSVINLSDPRSLQQLSAMAELVGPEQLDDRKNQDVVKCLFPLETLDAEDAVEELSAIKLMVSPSIFSKTNQLLITDTVAKLKSVKAILDSFEPSQLDNGTIVKSFALQHVEAEDVLVVARPHLGLATGEMIGIDVSLSADLQGKFIFATGIEDKVKLIEKLVESIDVAKASLTDAEKDAKLQTHPVSGGNVELAYDVLQTLLAGKEVRLSKDESAGTIVALATADVQEEIAATVLKLAAEEAQFEVIPLHHVDPFVAIGLIEQMLDLSAFSDDDEDTPIAPPKIDADTENGRLFVRGRPEQIQEIKTIVAGLDGPTENANSDKRVRLLNLRGEHATKSLSMAARFWRQPNPIMLFGDQTDAMAPKERVMHDDSLNQRDDSDDYLEALESKTPTQYVSLGGRGRILPSPGMDIGKSAIECQLTSRGLLLQCEDSNVLNEFEEQLLTLAGPTSDVPSAPIVYYLKFTRPDEAIRMLAELLDGGDAVDSKSDSLVNASISSTTSSLLGSLVTHREGMMTLIAGTATIVADSRLNRLIAQGTTEDIRRIEDYLKIIEKDNSITDIETHGRTEIIELVNTEAADVEAAVRQAFAGRIADAKTTPGAPGASGATRADANRTEENNNSKDKKADAKKQPKAPSQQARDLEPKMTLAVHEASNSLIVTAPEQLFKEVERLVKSLDDRGQQTIQVITPPNSQVLETVLQQMLLGQSPSRRREPPRSDNRSRNDK